MDTSSRAGWHQLDGLDEQFAEYEVFNPGAESGVDDT